MTCEWYEKRSPATRMKVVLYFYESEKEKRERRLVSKEERRKDRVLTSLTPRRDSLYLDSLVARTLR